MQIEVIKNEGLASIKKILSNGNSGFTTPAAVYMPYLEGDMSIIGGGSLPFENSFWGSLPLLNVNILDHYNRQSVKGSDFFRQLNEKPDKPIILSNTNRDEVLEGFEQMAVHYIDNCGFSGLISKMTMSLQIL